MDLIIVESPTKAKTIGKFVGKDFVVESSYGHIRDLPKSKTGIDVKHDRHGNPIEQGIGSAAQPSRNSIEAYKAHQMGNKFGPEKGFEENLARMEAEFAEFEKKRAARNAAAKAKRRKAA